MNVGDLYLDPQSNVRILVSVERERLVYLLIEGYAGRQHANLVRGIPKHFEDDALYDVRVPLEDR